MAAKYLDNKTALNRLIAEYKAHGKLIIAYDFDDTVCTYNKEAPEPTAERLANEEICQLIRDLRPYAIFILWTCRSKIQKNEGETNSALKEAELWLQAHNVPYDKVNDDAGVAYGGRKVYANATLDDRAGLAAVYQILVEFLKWLEGEQCSTH